ncbi:hypothetical protein DL95DRAFT_349765 [Leptodontidium sp. 2 PMI_412]|nr:hypothetical protein DL95DRAFT_349765 [Leptodontidium sp. 2 PMI_412]
MLFRDRALLGLGLVALLPLASSIGISKVQQQQGLYPITLIEQFPNPHWLENLAVRHDGQILATSASTPGIFLVDQKKARAPVAIADIPDATGALGIVELEQDVFYVIGANWTLVTLTNLAFPSKIWKVDLRPLQISAQGVVTRGATVSLVADLLSKRFANTLTRLGPNDNTAILVSDSSIGHIFRLDVTTGASTVVLSDATTLPPVSGGLGLGVSGIHVHGSDMFYANAGAQEFFKVPISLKTGQPTGPATLIVNNTFIDDFALSRDGKKAWGATNPFNTLVEIDIAGKIAKTVATNLFNATAVALGRTSDDYNSVYVVDGGGLSIPFSNPGMRGGSISKVNVC